MEEEISLKELFITLWQGRYIIIVVTAVAILVALAASLFLATQATQKYRATTSFNLEQHLDYLDHRMLEQVVRAEYIPLALEDLSEEPQKLARSASIELENGFVEITAVHQDSEVAVKITDQLRSFFCNQAVEHMAVVLRSERTSLKSWLELFDQQFSEHYEGYFITDGTETLIADPGYVFLMEERGRRIAMLHEVNHRILEFELIKEEIVADQYFPTTVTSETDTVRWQLNTAVAAVLGLMLSVMIVFVKPFADEVAAEIKSSKHDSE